LIIGLLTMLKNTSAGFLIAIVTTALYLMGWLLPLDQQLRDFRFSYDNRAPSGEIVLVDIDAKSIKQIGTWPWKRRIYANLLDKLRVMGAAEIAIDVDFSSASQPEEDIRFSAALKRAQGATILAVFKQKQTADSNNKTLQSNQPLPMFLDNAWPATVNVFPDHDGRITTFPYGGIIAGEPMQSIAAILSGYNGSTSGAFYIDFGLDVDRFKRFSVIDILNSVVPVNQIKGKKIIIGASSVELRDFFTVPRYGIISGHLLQAIAAETLLQDRAIALSDKRVVLLLVLALVVFLVIIMRFCSWLTSICMFAAATVLLEGFATWQQVSSAYSVQTTAPLIMIAAFAVFIILREIDLRKILLIISESRVENTRTILDRVIADNFEGVVIILEDDSIYAVSRAAFRLLKENKPDIPDDIIGVSFREISPKPFADAVTTAINDMKSGTWRREPPEILDGPYGTSDRKIFEYGVMPSKLGDTLTLSGKKTPGSVVACLSVREITKRKLANDKIAYIARFDSVTDLPNRNSFNNHVTSVLKSRKPTSGNLAIVCLSLNRIKNVQEALGHKYAEDILKIAVERALLLLSPSDFLACLGDNNFALLVESVSNKTEVEELIHRLIEELVRPYYHSGHGAVVGASAGIVMIDGREKSADTLIKNAASALNQAYTLSGNCVSLFEPAMEVKILVRQELELDLWKAFDHDQFKVYYQPQVLLSDGSLCGAEALLRWIHPEKGFISPAEFIPIAEQSNMIVDLGAWVLEQACKDAAEWPDHLKIAVNVSPVQFVQGNLVQTVKQVLRTTGISTKQLDLEITESLFIEDNTRILKIMDELRQMGIRFALDDFGTGYSSLGYIQRFPLDKIKIDQSFVRDLDRNLQSLSIVQTIAALANNLNMETVAEGIEEPEHHSLLRLAGCTIGQGYLYSKPIPLEDMLEFICPTLETTQSTLAPNNFTYTDHHT
jgi:diguanylate cyclase (GGDEF)-like protein